MVRKTPLGRARLAAAGRLAPDRSLEYSAAREAVLERSGHRCEICGRLLNLSTLHAHHRRARSAGQRDDSLPNLLALCGPCHNGGNFSVHAVPLNATVHGRIISRHDKRKPCQVPVSLRQGWCLLGEDGRAVLLPEWTPGP